ncbi:MAG: stage II sporulation protein R [Oscillospiraceae bacterium]|nr:stage II sporulation protein R [Oscillospiraceae bacterium]
MNKFKTILLLFFLLVLFVSFSAVSYVQAITENISDNVFRLHVIANSDSDADQNLKYVVRDEILKYVKTIAGDVTSKDELINIVSNNLDNIRKVAQDTVINNGFNYPVTVEIGNFDFPTKTYGDISLPAGFYDALRVKIGAAAGKNWWCVMFPPLCFVDVSTGIVPDSSKQTLQNDLSEESYDIISSNDNTIHFKFKILEMFNNIGLKLGFN